MLGFPAWLTAAFSKRIDSIGHEMHTDPQNQESWKQASALLEKFQSMLSSDQCRAFGEWEDIVGLLEARQKEEIYIRGFVDGFHVHACLREHMQKMVVKGDSERGKEGSTST